MKPSANLFFDVKKIEIQNIRLKFHVKLIKKKSFLLKPVFLKQQVKDS